MIEIAGSNPAGFSLAYLHSCTYILKCQVLSL
jgi:hypothetical protein